MDRQVFDDAIGASPPSTVDVEAIITRERRAGRFRWATNPGVAAGGAVLAVVIGVAAAVLPGQSGDSGSTVASPRTSSSTAPPPSTTGPPCDAATRVRQPPAVPETPNTAATRLTGVLTALIHAHSPGLHLSDRTGIHHEPLGPLSFQHLFSPPGQLTPIIPGATVTLVPNSGSQTPDVLCSGEADYFVAYANAADTAGTGSLSVIVARHEFAEPFTDCATVSMVCTRNTGPNGEIIATGVQTEARGTLYLVAVSRPDGTAVTLFADNVPDSLKSTNNAGRPTPPLGLNQLVAIATDPGMTLYPH